jgi:hypothetical protein
MCLDCAAMQTDDEHKLYLNLCQHYALHGKVFYYEYNEIFNEEVDLESDIHLKVSSYINRNLADLEINRFVVTTEIKTDNYAFYNLVAIRPTGYTREETEKDVIHSFCAYPEVHEED